MVDLLLDEVNQDVRRERLFRFLSQQKKPLIYAVIALILGTAGASVYTHYANKAAEKSMQTLTAGREAVALKNTVGAEKYFTALSTEAAGDVRDMANLWRARGLRQQQKNEEAKAVLLKLAESPAGEDLIWRDLACIELASFQPMPAVCASNETSPLKPQRLELKAAELIAQQQPKEAAALLSLIVADEATSSTAKARTKALLNAIESARE